MKEGISVVIPAYNAEQHMARCLDSVFSQSFSPIHVIVINDGSKDGTSKVLDDYKLRYSNLTVIDQENGGVSKARNAGIDAVDTEYMTFMDCDDTIDSDYLTTLYQAAQNTKADIVICGCRNMDSVSGKLLYTDSPLKHCFSMREGSNIVFWGVPWGKLYKSSLIKSKCYFTEGVLFEDDPYSIMTHSLANTVIPILYIGYNYYINNPNSYMGKEKQNQKYAECFPCEAYENAIRIVAESGSPEKKTIAQIYYLRMMMSILLRKTHNKNTKNIKTFHYGMCQRYSLLSNILKIPIPAVEKGKLLFFAGLTKLQLI